MPCVRAARRRYMEHVGRALVPWSDVQTQNGRCSWSAEVWQFATCGACDAVVGARAEAGGAELWEDIPECCGQ